MLTCVFLLDLRRRSPYPGADPSAPFSFVIFLRRATWRRSSRSPEERRSSQPAIPAESRRSSPSSSLPPSDSSSTDTADEPSSSPERLRSGCSFSHSSTSRPATLSSRELFLLRSLTPTRVLNHLFLSTYSTIFGSVALGFNALPFIASIPLLVPQAYLGTAMGAWKTFNSAGSTVSALSTRCALSGD